jgi:hypothetical protein
MCASSHTVARKVRVRICSRSAVKAWALFKRGSVDKMGGTLRRIFCTLWGTLEGQILESWVSRVAVSFERLRT